MQISDSVLHDPSSSLETLYFSAQTIRTKVVFFGLRCIFDSLYIMVYLYVCFYGFGLEQTVVEILKDGVLRIFAR